MKNENYINIQGWMVNDLDLKGNELLIYAIIYGFTQDGQNEYHGSMRYIADALKIVKGSVHNCIKKLEQKGLIEVSEIDRKNGNKYRVTSVQKLNATKKRRSKIDTQPVQKLIHPRSKIGTNNNNNINNTNNNSSELSSQGVDEVNEVMKIFYDTGINKAINFGNKTSRKSTKWLIDEFGFEETKKIANASCAVQGKKFAPVITTPHQLKEKIGALKIYFDRQRSNSRIVKI